MAAITPAILAHVKPDVQVRLGVTPGLVRMSVGLEAAEDLTADLAQALEASQQPA
jgi:O-succinylhomoserine sulfhydrylase